MRRYRRNQIYIIVALLIAVAGLGIGFAAFSSTLNISSSAIVTPNSDSFSLAFSSSAYAITTSDDSSTVVSGTGTDGAIGGITGLYRKYATGLTAQLTKPGQSLMTTIYVHNNGEYDAYLNKVNISNINGTSYKKCVAATGTTDQLVQSACEGIDIIISIDGNSYSWGQKISNHKIEKDEAQQVIITISYNSSAARSDGNFDIEFGDITLEYSTILDSGPELLSFTVKGNTYYFEDGMTWADWIESSYNYDNRIVKSYGLVCVELDNSLTLLGNLLDSKIESKEYNLTNLDC